MWRGYRIVLVSLLIGVGLALAWDRAQADGPKVGEKAPAFSVKTITGETLTLKHDQGKLVVLLESTRDGKKKVKKLTDKVVFLDFWATWCPPCRAEIPHLQALHRKHGGEKGGLLVIGVSVDREADDVKKFVKENKVTYLSALGTGNKVVQAYGISSIPAGYVIDPRGVIRHVHIGFAPGDEKKLEREIKALLPAPEGTAP